MEIEIREAARWMWNNRANGNWLRPLVLTPNNPDPTSPNLNQTEAESLFMTLLEERLIFLSVNQAGEPVYLLNVAKDKEWNEFFKKHNIFYQFFKKLFVNFWGFLRWFLAVLIASLLAGIFSGYFKVFFEKTTHF